MLDNFKKFVNEWKEPIKETVWQSHLYDNPLETMIKGIVWGVMYYNVVQQLSLISDNTDIHPIGLSCLLFSISLVMEFATKCVNNHKKSASNLIGVLFLSIPIIMTFYSWRLMSGESDEALIIEITKLPQWMLFFAVIDLILSIIVPKPQSTIDLEKICDDYNDYKKAKSEQRDNMSMFYKHMREGKLGDIPENEMSKDTGKEKNSEEDSEKCVNR